jgi:hypothetical protein
MGRRHDHLIEQIADWDNLLLAHKKARKGKRDRDEVAEFSADLWANLGGIQNELLAGIYRMGEYRDFVIYEPQKRDVMAAPYRDRVVQHAVMNILEPIWDKCLIEDARACRKGKGTHNSADRVQRWVRDMSKSQPLESIWVVKSDWSKYFKNIRHCDVKRIYRRKIACRRTLLVLDAIVDSIAGPVELALGNLSSQWKANLNGGEIDQWAKREWRARRYMRYMDDIVAIFSTHIEAQLFASALERKSAELGLRFSKLSIHRASQGINYLGYRIWPTHRLLRKRAIVRFRRDAKRIARHIEEGRATRHDMLRRMQSFYAYAKHADTFRLRRRLFAECVTLVKEAERSRRRSFCDAAAPQQPPLADHQRARHRDDRTAQP